MPLRGLAKAKNFTLGPTAPMMKISIYKLKNQIIYEILESLIN
jgi:hypothetical protein